VSDTLRGQLASVRAAIAQIEGGAQEAEFRGRRVRRADLMTLYKREESLLARLSVRGGIRLTRVISK
jgi:hypothetical protein